MSNKLFNGSDESDAEDLTLGTNKEYAKSYNKFRQKELLKKFKDRGLGGSDTDSSSESESSDEDEVTNPQFDQEFFKTLASLKSKDPAIYDKKTKFFESLNKRGPDDGDDDDNKNNALEAIPKSHIEKKSKPITLKDYERNIILERGGKFEDDSDVEETTENERPVSPSAVEAERDLRDEFRKVVNANEDSDDEEFGRIFKKRVKTKEESAKEEEDFINWLAGKKENIKDDVKQILEPLKNYWNNSKLPQSEQFLRDYILNKGYAETCFADIPTYDEIVGDVAPLSEDEAELEKQAEFEHKYNFRFEEPDAEFVTRYPRTIENSVRRTDDKRKQKRVEVKERKQQEKQQKMKEIEIIKEMKRKEIEEKIQKLKMVTGNDELGFKDEELDEDFDPDAHDRRMQEIFNDDYYQVNEDEEKPECPSDIDELKVEDWDNYDPQRENTEADVYGNYEPHCEDDDFNMDCEYDPAAAKEQLQKELIESTRGRKNRKGRKTRFMEMIKAEKPSFNPEDEKTYADYIDEYYNMDCEDIIGDIPCRFKYVETTPNDFGLTIEEILLAKNKELNQWASLKKATQIRPDYVEKKEQRLYKMKAKNEDLKRKIFKSLYGDGSDDEFEHEKHSDNVASEALATVAEIKIKQEENISPKAAVLEATSTVAEIEAKQEENPSPKAAVLKGTSTVAEIETKKEENLSSSNATKTKKKRKRQSKTSTLSSSGNAVDTSKYVESLSEVSQKKPKLDVETVVAKGVPILNENNSTSKGISNKKKKKKKSKKVISTALIGNLTTNKKGQPTLATPIKTPLKADSKAQIRKNLNAPNSNKNAFSENKSSKFKRNNDDKRVGPAGKLKSKSINTKKGDFDKDSNAKISNERLKAYGINPRKFHKKVKYGKNKQKSTT